MVNTRKSSLRPLGKAAAAAAGAGSHFISSRTRSSKRGTKADAAGLEEAAAARCELQAAGLTRGCETAHDNFARVAYSLGLCKIISSAYPSLGNLLSVMKALSLYFMDPIGLLGHLGTLLAHVDLGPAAKVTIGHLKEFGCFVEIDYRNLIGSFASRKDEGSDASLSDSHISPPAKRTSKHADPVCKDKSKPRSAGQREEWSISAGQSSTAEAVLQEMDNINIRRNRRSGEVERLRMWTDTEFENMDMYSRVKRRRKSLRRNSYGIQNHHEVSTEGEEEESQEEDGDIEVEEAEGEENDRPYNLRQRKTVERYQAPPIVPAHQKKRENTLFDIHRSPARRSHIRRKKHAIHSSDTTSSDEERFERRKSKSIARARNRCLPLNFRAEDLASGILRERVKVGASLADVDPMIVDKSVCFDSIGGLSHHILALKEMVVFPLLYPEIFEKFKIQPPRGCLFYGPPGTGKTLVARALANECSQGDKKVAFFMRKGADCLSKWVGESERQLRLLFDQAYLMRPSIIFFDEIDGLAPVRSSRQDQIHSSIVSTLLALMDGLDNRGEIVVIGATNRLDSIDPALRRPGRFDREFLFNLPDKKARKHILQIHTRDWNPKLSDPFLGELAEKCVGYCGADIKALCTEAALIALRRRYPQIYMSSQKLQLDIFREARRTVPSIVYMPHIGDWWEAVSETVRATFLTLLQDIPSFSPIFLLSTSESMFSELPEEVKCIFRIQYEEVFYIQRPSEEDRLRFFKGLILDEAAMPPPRRKQAALRALEVLPLALPCPARELSEAEKQRMEDQEENTLRELRLFLRDVTKRLATDKRFNIFSKPVDIEEVSDYLEVIKEPMDLSTVITKIDKHNYLTAKDFLTDIDLICSNALEYNPDKDPGDKIIRHRACTLKDTAHAIIAAELDPEFNKMCEEIKEARRKRGLSVPAEQINPHGSTVRKTEARVEEAFRNKQKPTMAVWPNSANKCAFRIRRKSRRRSQWGKGIIKKRKVNNLKKDEDDAKFADDENHGEDSKLLENGELEIITDCIEENGEETGDLSMTNDESSCDVMDIDAEQRLNNGTSGKENNFASTEEESSNESLLITDSVTLGTEKELRKDPTSRGDCVNGETSVHSSEGVPAPACHNGKMEALNAGSPCDNTDGSSNKQKSLSEDQPEEKMKASSESQGTDLVKAELPHCSNNEKTLQSTDIETKDAEADKEGISKGKKTRKVTVEQSKPTSLEQVPEEPSDPVPPVVVDHDRLKKLLDLVVKKSDNLTVDQLERLYSLLSQCIYRHRRDYDKSQLIEEMERTVHVFETFL
ncbi:ATPase family AAA domain-containing protein 2B [Willisornis vidua]|uniref:ATPase family AAA domain-containing protein 2B n=1 Tax=Willisornis vidua TaxID=1566151 RepID=A0ABQ9CZ64_9PASS|nr:ATPase family AAA domain-containing protein 2B [Willisornis vidua]